MNFSDKLQKKLEGISDADFKSGWYDGWFIFIQKTTDSIGYRYLNCTYDTEKDAIQEIEKINKDRKRRCEQPYFIIEPRHVKYRKLKKPISFR